MPVRGPREPDWPDFVDTAWRQFLRLPPEVQDALVALFPELVLHPTRPSATMDIVPIRNDPSRWRLKVPGYRVLYQVMQGHPLVEEIEPRTTDTYVRFGHYSRAHPPR